MTPEPVVAGDPARPISWMLLLAVALPVIALLVSSAPVEAADRELEGSLYSGVRAFNEELGFNGEVAYGGRLLMRIDDRFSIGADFEASDPLRVRTGRTAMVSVMRSVVRFDLLRGTWRPYLCGGLGFILFDFGDAPNTAMGLVTGGGGVVRRLGESWIVFAEGSADMYRSEEVLIYNLSGSGIVTAPRSTEFLGSVVLGIGRRF